MKKADNFDAKQGLVENKITFQSRLDEALSDGKIRVFSSKKMKDYIKDIDPSEIKSKGNDLKVKDLTGFYLVNRVELEDGTKGYIWSKNQKLD